MPSILFFRNRCVALLWKSFEFLSPWVAHNARDLWNHILISLSRRSLTSHQSCLARKLIPKVRAFNSALAKSFCFSCNSLLILPKFLLLHCLKVFPHCSIFGTIPKQSWEIQCLPHSVVMVSVQPYSASHISSKWKGLSGFTGSKISGMISRGEWSDVLHVRCCTDEPPNCTSHSLFAKLLSNLSQMVYQLW